MHFTRPVQTYSLEDLSPRTYWQAGWLSNDVVLKLRLVRSPFNRSKNRAQPSAMPVSIALQHIIIPFLTQTRSSIRREYDKHFFNWTVKESLLSPLVLASRTLVAQCEITLVLFIIHDLRSGSGYVIIHTV